MKTILKKVLLERRLQLIHKFIIVNILMVLITGFVLGGLVTKALEISMVKRTKDIIAGFISEEVRHELTVEDLYPTGGGSYFDLYRKVAHINLGQLARHLKIWNRNLVVIWSDEMQFVGQRYPGNEEVERALRGEIVSEITTQENIQKKYGYGAKNGKLLEIYVPIRFRHNGEVQAVFEMYQNIDDLYKSISQLKFLIWITIFGLFTIFDTILIGMVSKMSKHLECVYHDDEVRKEG